MKYLLRAMPTNKFILISLTPKAGSTNTRDWASKIGTIFQRCGFFQYAASYRFRKRSPTHFQLIIPLIARIELSPFVYALWPRGKQNAGGILIGKGGDLV